MPKAGCRRLPASAFPVVREESWTRPSIRSRGRAALDLIEVREMDWGFDSEGLVAVIFGGGLMRWTMIRLRPQNSDA
jgi:hypothetical protein